MKDEGKWKDYKPPRPCPGCGKDLDDPKDRHSKGCPCPGIEKLQAALAEQK